MEKAILSAILKETGDLKGGEICHILNSIKDHQPLYNKTPSTWYEVFKVTNVAINDPKSKLRVQGLSLLACIVEYTPPSILSDNVSIWISAILKLLQDSDTLVCTADLALQVLSSILEKSASHSDVCRTVGSDHIVTIVTTLINTCTSNCSINAVVTLTTCLTLFPGPCSSLRKKIEKLLLSYVDCGWLKYQHVVAKCLCKLTLCLSGAGGGGSLVSKHTESWSRYLSNLMKTLHHTLSRLYSSVEDASSTVPGELMFELCDISVGDVINNTNRLIFLLISLESLISDLDYPAPVKVPVPDLLTLIYRITAVSLTSIGNRSSVEINHLVARIPRIHLHAVKLLTALIDRIRGRVLPHGNTIRKQILQTLNWTQSKSFPNQLKPYSDLRMETYKLLNVWLLVATCNRSDKNFCDVLVRQIECDLEESYQVSNEVLSVNNTQPQPQQQHQRNRKRKHWQTNDLLGDQGCGSMVTIAPNNQLCHAALVSLKHLIQTTGSIIRVDTLKTIHNLVIPLALDVQRHLQFKPCNPYTVAMCRQALYDVILSCVLVTHPDWPTPIQPALMILSRGQTDPDLKVVGVCKQALLVCQSVINHRIPSLHPVPIATTPPTNSMEIATPPTITMETATPPTISMETATPPTINMETPNPPTITMETPNPPTITMATASPPILIDQSANSMDDVIVSDSSNDDTDRVMLQTPQPITGQLEDDDIILISQSPALIPDQVTITGQSNVDINMTSSNVEYIDPSIQSMIDTFIDAPPDSPPSFHLSTVEGSVLD